MGRAWHMACLLIHSPLFIHYRCPKAEVVVCSIGPTMDAIWLRALAGRSLTPWERYLVLTSSIWCNSQKTCWCGYWVFIVLRLILINGTSLSSPMSLNLRLGYTNDLTWKVSVFRQKNNICGAFFDLLLLLFFLLKRLNVWTDCRS